MTYTLINNCVSFFSQLQADGTITVAYYSHLLPVVLGLFLAGYALYATKWSNLSIKFAVFFATFALWLVCDLVIWLAGEIALVKLFGSYSHVVWLWSFLDFINILFFVLGAYFFVSLCRPRIQLWNYVLYLLLLVPALLITVSGQSILFFDAVNCDAINNSILTNIKLLSDIAIIVYIVYILFVDWKYRAKEQNIQLSIVGFSLVLFFLVFGITEYISSTTALYTINLYGLFVLPIFLLITTFAITDLRLFQLRFVGSNILAYIFIIIVGSQFFYAESVTSFNINFITFAFAVCIAFLLIENSKKETEARTKIESLAQELKVANGKLTGINEQLKIIDQRKDEFLSMASHQLRTPISTVKGYVSNILDGTYGPVDKHLLEPLGVIRDTSQTMNMYIEDYLNISRIEQNRMKYDFAEFDLHELVKEVAKDLKPTAEKRALELTVKAGRKLLVTADKEKIRQIISNITDNALKYTEKGSVALALKHDDQNAVITIQDTGIGISEAEMPLLFNKFSRSKDAHNVNLQGTGLGLYVAKQLAEGHHGTITVSSKGHGHGSTFTVSLPIEPPKCEK